MLQATFAAPDLTTSCRLEELGLEAVGHHLEQELAALDLTPNHEKTGPARLLDMVEGRSKAVFKGWLAGYPKAWRDEI